MFVFVNVDFFFFLDPSVDCHIIVLLLVFFLYVTCMNNYNYYLITFAAAASSSDQHHIINTPLVLLSIYSKLSSSKLCSDDIYHIII